MIVSDVQACIQGFLIVGLEIGIHIFQSHTGPYIDHLDTGSPDCLEINIALPAADIHALVQAGSRNAGEHMKHTAKIRDRMIPAAPVNVSLSILLKVEY